MVICIICRMEIIKGKDKSYSCPNNHHAHLECLAEWIEKSPSCPLCREPYSKEIIDELKSYKKEKDLEQQQQLTKKLKIEEINKVRVITDKIKFLNLLEEINNLINKKQYDLALKKLDSFDDSDLSTKQGQDILFLKGKINYLRKRYDLAINQLFRLVKKKFDYPDAFLYLGKAYQELGLYEKAKWAFERVK
ncbi:MAG: RING finger domain-containing protein [Promethearchaeota archaeon]